MVKVDLETTCAEVRENERQRIRTMLVRYGHAAAASLIDQKKDQGQGGDPLSHDEKSRLWPSGLETY